MELQTKTKSLKTKEDVIIKPSINYKCECNENENNKMPKVNKSKVIIMNRIKISLLMSFSFLLLLLSPVFLDKAKQLLKDISTEAMISLLLRVFYLKETFLDHVLEREEIQLTTQHIYYLFLQQPMKVIKL